MVSEYQYITRAELEAFTGTIYASISSSMDSNMVDAQISAAEMYINTYMATSYTGTIPDAIKLATKIITGMLLENWMFKEGVLTSIKEPYKNVFTEVVTNILDRYKKNSDGMVDEVRMDSTTWEESGYYGVYYNRF